jgi:phosphoserine phosphatase RsbU/P
MIPGPVRKTIDRPDRPRITSIGVTIFILIVLLLASSGTLHAQDFDLSAGRLPIASLAALRRLHAGENSAWANPNFDDSQYSLPHSNKGWAQWGYRNYNRLAWYRFQATVPAGLDNISLRRPTIRTGSEVYADRQRIGAYGKMPPGATPYGGGGPQI